MALAVAVTLATPEALVVAVSDDSVALAPDAGTANVTVTPGTGKFELSRTVTCSGLAKAVEMTVVCGRAARGADAGGGGSVRQVEVDECASRDRGGHRIGAGDRVGGQHRRRGAAVGVGRAVDAVLVGACEGGDGTDGRGEEGDAGARARRYRRRR